MFANILFVVNVILVMGSEKIHRDMSKRFEGQRTSTDDIITVVKLDKSGGCVDRDEKTFMKPIREAATREYFFGDAKRTLSPHIQQIDFNALTIYQIRECKFIILFIQIQTMTKTETISFGKFRVRGTGYGECDG